MLPRWAFRSRGILLLLRDRQIKQAVHDLHQQANAEAAEMFADKRQQGLSAD